MKNSKSTSEMLETTQQWWLVDVLWRHAKSTPPTEVTGVATSTRLKVYHALSKHHHILTMSDTTEQPKKERFAPKEPVTLNPPKDDVITRDYLAKCDGMHSSKALKTSHMLIISRPGTNEGYPTLVAIKVRITDLV